MALDTEPKSLIFVADDPGYYADAWYECEDRRRDPTPEERRAIDAFFAGVDERLSSETDLAVEIAGWIPPGFDPDGAFEMVAIDRVCRVAVYIRKDGTRAVKPIAAFIDDPFTAPPDARQRPAAKALRSPPRFKFIREQLASLLV